MSFSVLILSFLGFCIFECLHTPLAVNVYFMVRDECA